MIRTFLLINDDAHPGTDFLQTFAIFRMGKSVNDGVVNGRRLGADDGNFRDQGRDVTRADPGADHGNGRERSPGEYPQHDVDDGDFGDAHLGRNGVLLGVVPQRGDVHLFGLLAQLFLVMENGLDDEEVTADDDQNGTSVLEETRRQDVTLVVHRRRVRVKGTPDVSR